MSALSYLDRYFVSSPEKVLSAYIGSYDYPMVVVSVLISIFASFCAFEMVARLSGSGPRRLWLSLGAVILGAGIWAMHFIGMLAFRIDCGVSYDPWITGFSMLPGILAAAVALDIDASRNVSRSRLLFAGVVMALGVAIMHYSGMAAIHLDGILRYDAKLFLLSLLVAALLAVAALWSMIFINTHPIGRMPFVPSLIGGTILGGAISSMHYIAMEAAYFIQETPGNDTPIIATSPTVLAIAVAVVAVLLIFSGLLFTYLGTKVANVRNRIEAILATTSQGFVLIDKDGFISESNPAMSALLNMPEGVLVGRRFNTLFDSQDTSGMSGNYQQEAGLVRSDGSPLPCMVHGNDVRDEDGKLLYSFALFSDISERVEAEKKLKARQQQFLSLLESTPDPMVIVDAQGNIRMANHQALGFFGYVREELIGKPVEMLIPKNLRHAHVPLREGYGHDPTARTMGSGRELLAETSDGRLIPVEVSLSPIQTDEGMLIASALRDITERRQYQMKLEQLLVEQKAILDNRLVGIATLCERKIVWANPAFENMFGYNKGELEDAPIRLVHLNDESYHSFGAEAYPFMQNGNVFRAQRQLLRKDGKPIWVDLNGATLNEERGESLWVFVDITELKEAEEQIRNLAFYDPLTLLPNRRMLNDRLSQAMAASKRNGHYCTLMVLDLDNFKPLNDVHGHMVGDLLLVEVAKRLKSCVREVDTVARFGGDEFVVLLVGLAADKTESTSIAGIVAEKIRNALSEPYLLTVSRDGKEDARVEHHCTASIGAVVFINHEGIQDDIMKWADAAMYQAKEAGRNLIRFYVANA